jgi:hypothetical protein
MSRLFRGLPRAYGVYKLFPRPAGGQKVEGDARTVRRPVTELLWQRHLSGSHGLGIVPITDEAVCYFGAIDIDKYDVDPAAVGAKIVEYKLPLLPCRTKSNGLHLYLFSAEGVPAALLQSKLEKWAVALGFGGSEIFPKQVKLLDINDVGNWINMPYFGGDNSTRYCLFRGVERLSLEQFLGRAEQTARLLTAARLAQIEPNVRSVIGGEEGPFFEGPPCLQSLAAAGGFPEGARNNAMFAVGVYLRKRYPEDWKDRAAAYNISLFNPPMATPEVNTTIKSVARKEDYNYPCTKHPIVRHCNRMLCKTRQFGVGANIDEWNVVIETDVLKVKTDPPFWILTVNGARMQFFTEELFRQANFQRIVFNAINVKPSTLSTPKWDAEINRIGQNAQEVEAPEGAGVASELVFHLRQFCTVHTQAETREELLTGKPYIEEGTVYFRGEAFKQYLESKKVRYENMARVFSILRTVGAAPKQFRINNEHPNIAVWSVPAYSDVPVAVPPRSVPGTEGGM